MRKAKSKMKKKLGVLLMAVGIISIIASAGLLTFNKIEDKKAQESSNFILSAMQYEIKNSDKELNSPRHDVMSVKEIDGFNYIGYISIPKIDRTLPILSEWDFSILRMCPARYCGSIYTDDMVLASHSYVYHFGPISKLEPNDDVYFTDMEGLVTSYKVTNVEFLRPNEVERMVDASADLTLFTCDYSGTRRVTVRCDKVK